MLCVYIQHTLYTVYLYCVKCMGYARFRTSQSCCVLFQECLGTGYIPRNHALAPPTTAPCPRMDTPLQQYAPPPAPRTPNAWKFGVAKLSPLSINRFPSLPHVVHVMHTAYAVRRIRCALYAVYCTMYGVRYIEQVYPSHCTIKCRYCIQSLEFSALDLYPNLRFIYLLIYIYIYSW